LSEHDSLFDAYVSELRSARELAETWWSALEAAERARGGDDVAVRLARRWPFGPASHPWVIAVYRKYWLACDDLNQRLVEAAPSRRARPVAEADWGRDDDEPEISQVPPRTLVVEQLEREGLADLHELVLMLPFVPIGQKHQELV
jgi:hypothetical protein